MIYSTHQKVQLGHADTSQVKEAEKCEITSLILVNLTLHY